MNIRELRHILGKAALVCLAGGGIAGTASAATYYVGTNGNDGNPGTQTAP